MRTVCIVQARLGSSRLPRKVLLPLNGHTVLIEVMARCAGINGVDEIVCATPDAEIAEHVDRFGFSSFIGSEHDVLGRYWAAARALKADAVVRVTADCPLISPQLCAEVILALKRSGADYASNVHPRTFPKGMDCEAFTMATLDRAQKEATAEQREHVTTWMLDADIRRVNVRCPWPLDGRLTLDTWDDYQAIRSHFDGCLRAA